MKKIIFTLYLFATMQNAFSGEHYYYHYVNHTLNISATPDGINNNVFANIGDSVSLYIYNTYYQGPVPTGDWAFAPCSPGWNCYTSWDTVPNSFMQNPLNVVITQYGSYVTFSDFVHQFTPVPPSVPAMPNPITGRKYGVCGLSNVVYSTTITQVGVSYIWTVPPGATIVSGQYTGSIRVNYPGTPISGQVSLTINNVIGPGPARTLSINSNPATPSAISGPVTVCSGSSGNVYSINPVFSAVSYKWVGPPGCHIKVGTTTSTSNWLITASPTVTVNFGSVPAGSVLKVKANNNCGSSNLRTLTLIPCSPREESASVDAEPGHIIDFLNVFPSPVQTSVTVNLKLAKPSDVEISVLDINGKQLKTYFYKNISGEFIKNENTEALAKGIYFLRIKAGVETVQKKFIKM